MKVMVLGKLENPTLNCIKGIKDKVSGEKIIPLAVKRGAALQRFRLPFKNLSSLDTEFEFIFIKSPKSDQDTINEIDNFDPQSIFEHMQFFCQPSVLQMPGSVVPEGSPDVPASLLNVQIKVDTEWFKHHVPEDRLIKLPKLLIARVKGTSLL